ncbi:MAG: copper amine oxidase N-terminal domain-containing protein [Lachnospiraceae bacterium]|nr:copper amine oxidase N-terminal domain-containing protein [Lachnospiraceae bacterium]
MKKRFFRMISTTLICALSLTGGISVFAEVKTNEPMLIEAMENTSELNFTKYYGKVSSLVKEEVENGATSLTISDDYGEVLILNTNKPQKIYDAENKAFISLDDIKEGDNLFIIVNDNIPMTMSLPPMINNTAYIIRTNDMMNLTVGMFDKELISSKDDLMLNIAPETFITDVMGSRKIFTAEDIKDAQCAVVYSFATMSIPAQTTPDAVIILKNAPVADESYNIPLRSTFETMGYEVKWTANDKPIIIANADTTISVAIGSKIIIINGNEYELKSEAALINGITFVDSSILNFIK